MMSQRSLVLILSALLVLAGAGIVSAEGEQAGLEAAPAAALDTMALPEAVPAEEPAETSAEESTDEPAAEVATVDALLLPPAPPPSLQTLVDERRDALRRRREAVFDAMLARNGFLVPYDHRIGEGYQDAMRALHRRQRDYAQLRHDGVMDAMSPWHKSRRDWARIRSYLIQMDQLDRREAYDAWLPLMGHPIAHAGPMPW